MLLDYFTRGTRNTITGKNIGIEVETDFVDRVTGRPISTAISQAIQAELAFSAVGFAVHGELGRQKIELAINPHENPNELIEDTYSALRALYKTAARYGAVPRFEPEIKSTASLLAPYDLRDRLWLELDGQEANEELCRCSSVQFTIDVNPQDALAILNSLWAAQLHQRDYEPNDRRWRNYIAKSKAGYRDDRYGGPSGFESLDDYVRKLQLHRVVMHEGQAVSLEPKQVSNLNVELFLRSVWWHYRLRKHARDVLAVEIRPFARRRDEDMITYWNLIAPIFGRELITGTDRQELKPVPIGL